MTTLVRERERERGRERERERERESVIGYHKGAAPAIRLLKVAVNSRDMA